MRAVLLHPHPDMGGDMHNNVVSALYDALPDAHRFNFASSDLGACRAQAVDALGDGPAWLVGYSFGGGIAALVDDPRVAGWFLIAPALAAVTPVIGADPRPKAVLAAGYDQHFSPASLREATADWVATDHFELPGSDHFFNGSAALVARQCLDWMAGRTP
jgi:alpha/beta superfamily hydrolase